MRKIIAFFTGNWGLKILALLLAIAVYYSLKESTHGGGRGYGSPNFLGGTVNGGK